MRTRIYNKCTDQEITEYLDRGGDTLFIGIGVTELHGQLPVDCESILTEGVALAMAEKADGLALINLPYFHAGATAIGRSTINISIRAGYDYLLALIYAVYKLGFKKIVMISAHGPAYLTINSVCMDFFHATHNPILHIDLPHAINIAKENGWQGSGDMMDQMIRLAASRNISDRFHFTGFMRGKQVYEVLKASDVYVMPSVSEPFGISPLEAMQCGVPSIISKQSGCAEILNYAMKVDYWDIEALADAMYSIITYPAMHEFLKVEGKREVDEIKWEYAGQKVRRIYDMVTGNK